MQNNTPYIRGRHIILHDVSGIECAFSAEDMLRIHAWCYDHNVELVSMCYQPPEFLFHRPQEKQEEREQLL